jgi:hypothetical protein
MEVQDQSGQKKKILKTPTSTNSWTWWQVPVILAMQKPEIGRIIVLDQPSQKSLGDLISPEKSWEWWYMLIISAMVGNIK